MNSNTPGTIVLKIIQPTQFYSHVPSYRYKLFRKISQLPSSSSGFSSSSPQELNWKPLAHSCRGHARFGHLTRMRDELMSAYRISSWARKLFCIMLCHVCLALAAKIEMIAPLDGQFVVAGKPVHVSARVGGLKNNGSPWTYEAFATTAGWQRVQILHSDLEPQHGSLEWHATLPNYPAGKFLLEFGIYQREISEEPVAVEIVHLHIGILPPYVGESWSRDGPGVGSVRDCVLVVNSSASFAAGGGLVPEQLLVGFVESEGEEPRPLHELEHRRCMMYRVVDAVMDAGAMHSPRANAALLSGVGPVDRSNLMSWSFWNEKTLPPIIANKFCFARSEGMDFLFIVATENMLQHENGAKHTGYYIKLPGMKAALEQYQTVAWVDMDGYMSFAPRPPSRSCYPFTDCWPESAKVVLSVSATDTTHFPITAVFFMRRSIRATALLNTVWASATQIDQTGFQDAILSTLAKYDLVQYNGECGRHDSKQDHCWMDLLHGQELSFTHNPVDGLYMNNQWCRPDPISNLTLTCPCNLPHSDWCSNDNDAPCAVQWCMSSETIFVHFGTFQTSRRLHEVAINNAWSCRLCHEMQSKSKHDSCTAKPT